MLIESLLYQVILWNESYWCHLLITKLFKKTQCATNLDIPYETMQRFEGKII